MQRGRGEKKRKYKKECRKRRERKGREEYENKKMRRWSKRRVNLENGKEKRRGGEEGKGGRDCKYKRNKEEAERRGKNKKLNVTEAGRGKIVGGGVHYEDNIKRIE